MRFPAERCIFITLLEHKTAVGAEIGSAFLAFQPVPGPNAGEARLRPVRESRDRGRAAGELTAKAASWRAPVHESPFVASVAAPAASDIFRVCAGPDLRHGGASRERRADRRDPPGNANDDVAVVPVRSIIDCVLPLHLARPASVHRSRQSAKRAGAARILRSPCASVAHASAGASARQLRAFAARSRQKVRRDAVRPLTAPDNRLEIPPVPAAEGWRAKPD